jgi:hypothetical protein
MEYGIEIMSIKHILKCNPILINKVLSFQSKETMSKSLIFAVIVRGGQP